MIEEFRIIKEYNDYEVSNFGNVNSLKHNKRKELKYSIGTNGYFFVTLCKNGNRKKYMIHQLVAMSFLNHNPNGYKLVVDHIDFCRKNNNLSNLRIVTHRENANQKHFKSSSQYTGVSWYKKTKKFISRIRINGKLIHLGYHKTEIEAHFAYQNTLKNII